MARSAFVKTLEHFAHVDALMREDAGAVVILFHHADGTHTPASAAAFEAAARAFEGRPVTFAAVDVDARPGLAHRFQIGPATTVLFCSNGALVDASMGRLDVHGFARQVGELIGHAGGEGIFSRLFAFARGA